MRTYDCIYEERGYRVRVVTDELGGDVECEVKNGPMPESILDVVESYGWPAVLYCTRRLDLQIDKALQTFAEVDDLEDPVDDERVRSAIGDVPAHDVGRLSDLARS